MIEGIPIGQFSVISMLVGFILALLLMLFKGTIITRREADAMQRQIKHLTEANAELVTQLALLAEVGRTVEQLARGLQQEMDP